MGFRYYDEDIRTGSTPVVVTTATTSTTGVVPNTRITQSVFTLDGAQVTTSVTASTPVSEQTLIEEEVLPQNESDFEAYARSIGFNGSIEQLIVLLMQKNPTDLTDIEKQLIAQYERNTNPNAAVEQQYDAETIETIQQNITTMFTTDDMEQGTKTVMTRYYQKHNPSFANMSEEEKETFLNRQINEFKNVLFPEGITNQDCNKSALLKIATLYTIVEVGKTPIEEILSVGTQRVNEMLKETESRQLNALLKNVNPDNPLKSIEDFLKFSLQSDPEFAQLSDAQKDAFVKEKADAFIKNAIGFDMSQLPAASKKDVVAGTLAVIRNLTEEGKGVSDFLAMSPLEQSTQILNSLKANSELVQDEGTQRLIQQLETRAQLMRNAIVSGKDEANLTERDLYEELQKIGVENMTPDQKAMYRIYRRYEAFEPEVRDRLLNDKADVRSATAQRALLNISAVEYMKGTLPQEYQNKEMLLNNKDARDAYVLIAMSEESAAAIENYDSYLIRELGFTRDELRAFKEQLYAEHPELATRQANFKMRDVDQTPENQAKWDNIATSSYSQDMIDLFRPIVEITASEYNEDETVRYFEGQNDTTFYSNISAAVNQKSAEFGLAVEQKIANSKVLTDDKKTSATVQLIATADAQRQEFYAQEFSKISNKAVTEGLIQAEPYVKPEVQANYSNYVTQAINNNGYDSSTKAQLNQKRAEVQAAANGASSDAVVVRAPNTNTNKNTVQTPQTVSVPTYKNYGDDVARILEQNALNDKKEVVLQRLTDVIENYQKSVLAIEEQQAAASVDTSKSSQEAQALQVDDEIAQKFLNEHEDSGTVTPEVLQQLRSAYSNNGMVGLYEKLGSLGLGSSIQQKFLNYFALHSDFSALRSFANSYRGNDDIILTLYRASNDTGLLAYLSSDSIMALLAQGKIKMKDFLKYASASTVANYISELNKTGNHDALREIYGLLDTSSKDDMVATSNQRGGDAWFRELETRRQESSANYMASLDDGLAMGSNKVPMGRNYDKRKIRGPIYFNA